MHINWKKQNTESAYWLGFKLKSAIVQNRSELSRKSCGLYCIFSFLFTGKCFHRVEELAITVALLSSQRI